MPPLLSRSDVCEVLRISCSTLDRWIQQGLIPAADCRFGSRTPRWRRETIDAVIRAEPSDFH
jgi:excisionase family DNA binding protein